MGELLKFCLGREKNFSFRYHAYYKLIHHTTCYRPRFDGTSSDVGDNVDQTVDDEGGEVEGDGVVKRFKFGTQSSLN